MTTTGVRQHSGRVDLHPARSRSTLQRVLLGCGVLALVIYAALGMIEGIEVYANLGWIAVLAVAPLRRPQPLRP